ncbi:MAG TPA: hypothetical protein VJX66_15155 [Amycolatopsis sp.]|nr:hypothetical protein [Amycolatopsis sp.]
MLSHVRSSNEAPPTQPVLELPVLPQLQVQSCRAKTVKLLAL